MYSGQDGNGFAGANGFGQFGGAKVPGNLNNSQTQTPQGGGLSSNPQGYAQDITVQQQIVSSGQDIVLTPDKKSGGKLKWVVSAIVGALILAGVGVGVWWGMTNNQVDENNITATSVVDSFNEYANYLLFGEKKDVAIKEFNTSDTFAIDREYKNETYLTELLGLQNQFEEKILSGEFDFALNIPFSAMRERIEFLIYSSKMDVIDENDLYNEYYDNGETGAVHYVENFYSVDDSEKNYLVDLLEKYDIKESIARINFWSTGEVSNDLGEAEISKSELFYGSVSFLKGQCARTLELMEEYLDES